MYESFSTRFHNLNRINNRSFASTALSKQEAMRKMRAGVRLPGWGLPQQGMSHGVAATWGNSRGKVIKGALMAGLRALAELLSDPETANLPEVEQRIKELEAKIDNGTATLSDYRELEELIRATK